MNLWELCAVVLAGAILPCAGVCLWASSASALVALEVCGTLATTILLLLSEAFSRQPFVDLAVVLAVLTVVGSLAFARLMEEDL